MKSHSTHTGRGIGRHVLASLSVIVALAASVSAQSAPGTTGNPLAGGPAAAAGTGSPAPNATAGNWKTYKHPVGLSLRYPGDWTLQEAPGFIQLISPEVPKKRAGTAELYMVSAEQAGRISSLEDPRLIRALESSMTQIFPYLQRVGGMERIKAGNVSGIIADTRGDQPAGKEGARSALCHGTQGLFPVGLRNRSPGCHDGSPADCAPNLFQLRCGSRREGSATGRVCGKVGCAMAECRIGRAATPSERTEP